MKRRRFKLSDVVQGRPNVIMADCWVLEAKAPSKAASVCGCRPIVARGYEGISGITAPVDRLKSVLLFLAMLLVSLPLPLIFVSWQC
jgi:hypothetical protein